MARKISKLVSKKRLSHKKWLLIIMLTLVFFGCGVAAWWHFIYNRSITNQNQSQNAINKAESSQKLYDQADRSASSGDYAAGQALLDKSVKTDSSLQDQSWIYIQKTSIALNAKNYVDAYDFAKKAESIYPTENSAQLMGDAAIGKGDDAEAIKQYKIAINRITGNSEIDKSDKSYLESVIERLGGQL